VNIPNFISMIRILLVPVLVIFLMEEKMGMALLVFVVAGVSDGLDGFIARMYKQKTVLGAYLDPIADKLLLVTSYVALAIFGLMPGWLAVLVVSRDFIILAGVGVLLLNGKKFEAKPSITSKITTVLQLATVCFFLAYEYLGSPLLEVSLVNLTAFFTLLSGFFYIVTGFRILGKPDQERDRIQQ
jgi:cardiolipin synthase (CMP-forming)